MPSCPTQDSSSATAVSAQNTAGRVSVVIATYEAGRYLGSAVKSVLAQTRPVYEIHVVDDGSTDNTQQVMSQFAGEPRVHFHRQTNRGQAHAKNVGIRASSGDFIAFLDADDLWTPDKIAVQLPRFDTDPQVGVIYTDFAYIDEQGALLETPKRDYYSGWISGRLLVDNFVNGMSSIVRRECFESEGLFDESLSMGIDYDLWLRLSARYQFLFIDRITYLYRKWPGQMSRRREERMDCAIRIMKKFLAMHPGLVDKRTIDEAWAHTYVTRGRVAQSVGRPWHAIRDYLRALAYSPGYLLAWKAVVKLALPRVHDRGR